MKCKTKLTFCEFENEIGKTRIIQCRANASSYFKTIYAHDDAHGIPVYDSLAFPALRASQVTLDGSIDAEVELVSYRDEAFAAISGSFLYFFFGDTDSSSWHGTDFNAWNAVLHDGTLTPDGCSSNQTHSPGNRTNRTSPAQPPAPPIAPPPPSPPLLPPTPPRAPLPFNATVGRLALNTVEGWQFEILIIENMCVLRRARARSAATFLFHTHRKTRIYFEPGFAFEAEDLAVFVPKCALTNYTTVPASASRSRARVDCIRTSMRGANVASRAR